MDALVLAGGTLKDMPPGEEVSTKALIDINGKPMLEYILDVLRSSKRVGKIVVVLPSSIPDLPLLSKIDVVLRHDGTISDNFYAGLGVLDKGNSGSNKKVLVVSADIPLLTSEALDDFLDRCEEREASIYYPIISKATIEREYPDIQRTYMTLQEGKFTGGNLFLFYPWIAEQNKDLLNKASDARKSPFKLIKILGFPFLFKFIFHLLTVRGLEDKISDLIRAKGVAVNTPYVEIGIDVDKPSDFELVKSRLIKEGKGQ